MSACLPVPNLHVVYAPPFFQHDLLLFRTASHPELKDEPFYHADIARKRNLGLLLARLCGWHTIMFLDDDIRDLTTNAVRTAAGLTTAFGAASFQIEYYPDNSVVCHAYRLAGGRQDIFPGGSAMAVNAMQADTLFPPIYNEDWLFLFDAVKAGSVAVTGTLSQLEYKPFENSRRAASEEFGDLIAEGLYRLIHEGVGVADATYAYWEDALKRRSRLIDDVAERLLRAESHAPAIASALRSLAAARTRLTTISPLACVSFIHAWRADIDEWRYRLLGLPLLGGLQDATTFLGLQSSDRCVTPWGHTGLLPSTKPLR
jgi:hypothetical protein